MILRYTFRSLSKQPAFAIITIATLALGIGSATSIFSVIESVLLRPLPYEDARALAVVWSTEGENNEANASGANLIDWQNQNETFEGLAALTPQLLTRTDASTPERLAGVEVTSNFFDVMGSSAHLGRTFSDEVADAYAVVLSFEYWERAYGARADVLGEKLTLNDEAHTVIGVARAGFKIPFEDAHVWTRAKSLAPTPPIDLGVPPDELRGLHWLRVIGRLAPSVTLDSAQADMDVVAARLEKEYPDENQGRGIRLVPLSEHIAGDVRPALLILLGAVFVLLAIGCANVASLLLARASGRENEIAVRASLGASRARIVTDCLVESLVLALFGGLFGVMLSLGLTRLFLLLAPDRVFRLDAVSLNPAVLGFAIAVSLATGLVFGILPALQMSNTDVDGALRDAGRGSSGKRGRRTRSALVVVEVSLALVLLVLSGLLIKSFARLSNIDPGFRSGSVMTMRIWLPASRYPEGETIARTHRQIFERLSSLPGIESSSGVLGVPLSGTSANFGVNIEGREHPTPGAEWQAGLQSVAPDYFRTMGIPILSGRDVSFDDTEDSPNVALVNRTAAERFWPGEDPIGRRFSHDDDEWIEVVGVVGDVLHKGLDQDPQAAIYAPFAQVPFPFMTLVLRTQGDPEAVTAMASAEIRNVDPNLPVYKVMPMGQIVSESVASPRFNTFLLTVFAVTAIVLASVGLYGLMGMNVSHRKRELGIRLALGAEAGSVFRLVLKDGLLLAGCGIGLGVMGALLASRLLATFLFQVTTTDAATYVTVAVAILAVAAVATGVPARRASRTDPLAALRQD